MEINPDPVNDSAYNDGWIILLEPHELQLNPDDKQLLENLMEHDEYVEYRRTLNTQSLRLILSRRMMNSYPHGIPCLTPWSNSVPVLAAPVIWKGDHPYFIHPVTDGVPRMNPEVLTAITELAAGRVDGSGVDILLGIEAMGLPPTAPPSMATGIRWSSHESALTGLMARWKSTSQRGTQGRHVPQRPEEGRTRPSSMMCSQLAAPLRP